jgi:hypothetical protein
VYPAAAIRKLAQKGTAQPTHETSQVLSATQVFSLLSREPEQNVAAADGVRPPRRDTSLEDTLSELRDSAWRSFDLEDTASTTGVRHLRVEVQPKSRSRTEKAPKTARKL